MDDSNGSIMDLTKFSIRDTSYIVRHRQDGNAVVDPCDDVDAEMRFRYDDVYSEMTTNDSVSLPSYRCVWTTQSWWSYCLCRFLFLLLVLVLCTVKRIVR
jgi:hypothetical protein